MIFTCHSFFSRTALFSFVRSFVLMQKDQKIKTNPIPPGGIQPHAPGC